MYRIFDVLNVFYNTKTTLDTETGIPIV